MNAKLCALVGLLIAFPVAGQNLLSYSQRLDLGGRANPGDWFGTSVALSGDGKTLVVGAARAGNSGSLSGAAHVFRQDGTGKWTNDLDLELPATDADSTRAFDAAGYSVAISGNGKVIAVGAPLHDDEKVANSGVVYMWRDLGNRWDLVDTVTAQEASSNDQFGTSVALSWTGSVLVVGAPQPNAGSDPVGRAYRFVKQETEDIWDQERILSTGTEFDYFGFAVAVNGDGTVAAVGAPGAVDQNGAAYAFSASDAWVPVTLLTGQGAHDQLGVSVAISADGKTIAAGARGAQPEGSNDTGVVYVLGQNEQGSWSTVFTLAGPDATGSLFGSSVAMAPTGDTVLVGAPGVDQNQGASYLFKQGKQIGQFSACDKGNEQAFGHSVALSDLSGAEGTAAGGAPLSSKEAGSVCAIDLTGIEVDLKRAVDKVEPGSEVAYKIHVSNRSAQKVLSAILAITVDRGQLTDLTLAKAPAGNEDTIDYPLGDLAGRSATVDDVVLTLRALVRPEARGSLSISAYLKDLKALDLTPRGASTTDILEPKAQLSVENTVDQENAYRGDTLRYTITVTNDGPSRAVDSILKDTFNPNLLEAVKWTCKADRGAVCEKASGKDLLQTVLSIPKGGQLTYLVTAVVRHGVLAQPLETTASVINRDGAHSSEDIATTNILPEADLQIDSLDANSSVAPGNPFIVNIQVKNQGPDKAEGIQARGVVMWPGIEDSLEMTWTCEAGVNGDFVLLADGSTNCEGRAKIPSKLRDVGVTAQVQILSKTHDPQVQDNQAESPVATLSPRSRLALTVTPSPATPGEFIQYAFELSNAGPSDLLGATLSIPFPAALHDVLWACDEDQNRGELNTHIEVVAGHSVHCIATAFILPNEREPFTFDVGIVDDGKETIIPPDDLKVRTTVKASSKIRAILSLEEEPAREKPGKNVRYVLTLLNLGPSDLLEADLTLDLKEALQGPQWLCGQFDAAAQCSAGGAGNIDNKVAMPALDSLRYFISATSEADPEILHSIKRNFCLAAPDPENVDLELAGSLVLQDGCEP